MLVKFPDAPSGVQAYAASCDNVSKGAISQDFFLLARMSCLGVDACFSGRDGPIPNARLRHETGASRKLDLCRLCALIGILHWFTVTTTSHA